MTSVVSYDVWRTLLRGNASGRARQLALLAKLLGYMPKAQALAQGFTHHGEMYGIPCWVGDVDGEDGRKFSDEIGLNLFEF